jgi:hypothetical protein
MWRITYLVSNNIAQNNVTAGQGARPRRDTGNHVETSFTRWSRRTFFQFILPTLYYLGVNIYTWILVTLETHETGICGACGKIAYIEDGLRRCSACQEFTTECHCVDVVLHPLNRASR